MIVPKITPLRRRSGGRVSAARVTRVGHSLCMACRRQQQGGSGDQPVEIVATLFFDELDCKAIGQKPDNAADAGSNGERHSHWRLYFSGHRSTGDRHVDDEATMS